MLTEPLLLHGIALGTVIVLLSTYLYTATAIAYRRRDNGLAYLLFVMSVGIWSGMFAAQFLSADPLIDQFYYSLSIVGASLAALGWFLFAATASRTPPIPRQRVVFGGAAILVGLHIAAVVTAPIHEFYWTVPTEPGHQGPFTAIRPTVGYWVGMQLLGSLFAAGSLLFGISWERGFKGRYNQGYILVGGGTATVLFVSSVFAPGGFLLALFFAFNLATIGWLQAQRVRTADLSPIFPVLSK